MMTATNLNEGYEQTMSFPYFYRVFASTENREEYVMTIVGKDEEQAERAAKLLCESLGLIYDAISEVDD